jgi:hypothetical protein
VYFKRLIRLHSKQTSSSGRKEKVSDTVQVASYQVTEIISQQMKSLIFSACRTVVRAVLGDKFEQEIVKILLSNDAVRRRIEAVIQHSQKCIK